MVEKLSNLPKYAQVVNKMIDEIEEGRLAGKLDTEPELAAQYGVSRWTLREALHHLQREGVFVVKPGDGRYVVPQPTNTRPVENPGIYIEQRWPEITALHDHLCAKADLSLAGFDQDQSVQNFREMVEARISRDTFRSLAEPVQRLRTGEANEPGIAGNERLFIVEIERRFYSEILDIREELSKASKQVKKGKTRLSY